MSSYLSQIELERMATTTLTLRSSILVVLMTWLSTTPSQVLSVREKCRPHDRKTLLQIKREFNSPSLEKAWDPHTEPNCCSWDHVSCTNDRVSFIHFYGGLELHRPTLIPPSIANLPYINMIQLEEIPNLTGPIPTSFNRLKRLQFLTISHTNISGPIPEFLAQLNSLVVIDLAYNDLSGPIPASLTDLKNLAQIHFEGNHLSGPIPESFGDFSNLKLNDLVLSHNQLSGRIPASLGKLNLATVELAWNKLEGDASMLFGSNKKTNQLALSGNSLVFDFGKVRLPKELWRLEIDHNHIYGRLPQDLTELKILDTLNVRNNELCGPIPQGGNMNKFDASSYANNKCLCNSPLPPCKH
ncbi:hypothetical protein VNO77_17850 [Canavalia gladiata]|uniref:Leucine-rich repeat-containing N-terminal plant-type domain-containing protein n=1 Tax=Canavalia gladiata TaxID=3824 RepID=A0AAN9LJP1_CANGL